MGVGRAAAGKFLRVVPDIYKEAVLCCQACLKPSAVEMAVEFETFRMPYNRAVPWGLDTDSWVMLEGLILKQSKGFHVEFAYGQFNGANIPLKFKLYFERTPESSNRPVLTLNSFVNQQWGKEIQTKTHFQQGQKFKLSFIVTSKSYKIMENNILLSEFDHRLSPKAIRFLGMDGDIKLEKVVFSWERKSETSNPV